MNRLEVVATLQILTADNLIYPGADGPPGPPGPAGYGAKGEPGLPGYGIPGPKGKQLK